MRNGKVEILRFLFAAILVLFHSYATGKIEVYKYGVGLIAVEFFFMLSGYFMVSSAVKQRDNNESLADKTLNFTARKICAVMPEFAIAWLVGLVVYIAGRDMYDFKEILKVVFQSIWELLLLGMTGLATIRVNGVDWYISAMILSMLVLFPITVKYGEMYYKVFAWLIGIMILGILVCRHDGIANTYEKVGPFYKGMYRAVADISFGAALYPAVDKFNRIKVDDKTVRILDVIELLLWILLFFVIIMVKNVTYTPFIILLIWIMLVPTLSHYKENKLLNNKLVYCLGKYSLSLYLSHVYWARFLKLKYPELSSDKTMLMYFGLTFITSIFIFGISNLLRKIKIKKEEIVNKNDNE